MKKGNKGITLIALIITIIVMLILVGVSVTVALNGGLFRTAEEAADGTEDARDRELARAEGKVEVGGKTYASYEDYLNDNPIGWRQEGNKIKYVAEDGTLKATIQIGDTIGYDCYDETLTDAEKAELLYHKATIEETNNVVEVDDLSISAEPGKKIQVGDGTEPEFQVTSSDETRVWKVLGLADDGKLLITTDPINTSLIIAKYGTNVLNDISAIYGHGKHAESARSIKKEDITKLTGVEAKIIYTRSDYLSGDYDNIHSLKTSSFLNHGNYSLVSSSFFLNSFERANDTIFTTGYHDYQYIYTVSNGTIGLGAIGEERSSADEFDYHATTSYVKPIVVLEENVLVEKDDDGVWQFVEE